MAGVNLGKKATKYKPTEKILTKKFVKAKSPLKKFWNYLYELKTFT